MPTHAISPRPARPGQPGEAQVSDSARGPARGNRWGLALVGLVLVASGLAALAVGLGLLGRARASAPLLGGAVTDTLGQAWVPYAAVVLAVVVALLALWWMVRQGRDDTVRRLRVEPEPAAGITEMRSSTACDAFEDEVADYPGVRRARARMTESRSQPQVRLDLVLDADADASAIWREVRSQPLENLRCALELDRLPAVIRMSMAAPPKNPQRQLA
ncbi:alkaline shock response membrane anchor protein AmaP [Salinactinospora qingdaonensis]|uniref:Alkaline shock response membrane anchor protein AmaP n=1 Tax=Salinactinospora qingdaonensis TaxID=702744 RepID=A0ABP7GEF3_9ACTN